MPNSRAAMTHLTPALALAMATLGCGSDEASLGDQCQRNSECGERLSCQLGRCRAECVTSRDCSAGFLCLVDGTGVGACQTPEDMGCVSSGDCGGNLVCAFGSCRTACSDDAACGDGDICLDMAGGGQACGQCAGDSDCSEGEQCDDLHRCTPGCLDDRDCDGGATCSQGRCVARPMDGGATECLTPMMCDPVAQCGCPEGLLCTNRVDALTCMEPNGVGTSGSRCTWATETCAPGFGCTHDRACRQFCRDDGDCTAEGAICATLVQGNAAAIPGILFCTVPCDPITASGCVAGQRCEIQRRGDVSHTDCVTSSFGEEGAPCANDRSCSYEQACHRSVCRPLCVVGDPSCAACEPLEGWLEHDGKRYGTCPPP